MNVAVAASAATSVWRSRGSLALTATDNRQLDKWNMITTLSFALVANRESVISVTSMPLVKAGWNRSRLNLDVDQHVDAICVNYNQLD